MTVVGGSDYIFPILRLSTVASGGNVRFACILDVKSLAYQNFSLSFKDDVESFWGSSLVIYFYLISNT